MSTRNIQKQLNELYSYYEKLGRHPNLLTDPGEFAASGYVAGARKPSAWNMFVKKNFDKVKRDMAKGLGYQPNNQDVLSQLGILYREKPRSMKASGGKKRGPGRPRKPGRPKGSKAKKGGARSLPMARKARGLAY